jgi:predicted nucleic acid-binding protein
MPSAKTSCFIDTNILVYAVDPDEQEKRPIAADLLRRVTKNRTLVLSPQSLNECYRLITGRRGLMPRAQARRFIATFAPFCTAPSGYAVSSEAWRIQDEAGLGWWDCLLLAAALLAGAMCS